MFFSYPKSRLMKIAVAFKQIFNTGLSEYIDSRLKELVINLYQLGVSY